MSQPRSNRRDQILQALAAMLESNPKTKITTARLAQEVGVSEAALYRHFPSKTKMFEALIEFAEEVLFSRVKIILTNEKNAVNACKHILMLLLGFCEQNPGIARILHGEAITGEPERLHLRVAQLFDRLETELRVTLRQAELHEQLRPSIILDDAVGLIIATAEGRVSQFVRSRFKRLPTKGWDDQWTVLTANLMRPVPTHP